MKYYSPIYLENIKIIQEKIFDVFPKTELSSKINFSPGAKNWIPKYFQLVDQGFLSYNKDFSPGHAMPHYGPQHLLAYHSG